MGQETVFHRVSDDILSFLEERAWPLRIDLILERGAQRNDSESEARELARMIDADEMIRKEWGSLPAPERKNDEGEPLPLSSLERVRIHGLLRTRAYLVGAKIRSRFPEAKTDGPANWVESPLPVWRESGRAFGDSDADFELRLECAVLIDFFQRWLVARARKSDASRAIRWLEARYEAWRKLRLNLERDLRAGNPLPVALILKTQLLFDLGRASSVALSDAALPIWNQSAKGNEPRPLPLRKECRHLGYSSAQLSAIWAQAAAFSSSLATPLRLLARPWRSKHPQVKRAHAAIVDYLAGWGEGSAA